MHSAIHEITEGKGVREGGQNKVLAKIMALILFLLIQNNAHFSRGPGIPS